MEGFCTGTRAGWEKFEGNPVLEEAMGYASISPCWRRTGDIACTSAGEPEKALP